MGVGAEAEVNALTWEEERGQAESESPPASSGAREPHPSHRGPGSGARGGEQGAPRAPETSPEDEGGSLAGRRRSEDPGQPQPSAGAGWAGWVPRARPQSGPGLPPAQRLGRCPPQVARVMPSSPPPFSSPRRSPPSSSTQSRAGERDPPPARPAARLRGAGSRPPASSHPPARLQLAGVHGRPSSEGGGTSPVGGEGPGPGGRVRCGSAPAARAARAMRPAAWRARRVRRASPRRRSAGCRRSATMWSCLGAEASRARSSPSLSLTRELQPWSP